ncbi:MAG: thioredoxin domain-containing protein [Candidatus ainarchaeum sp.]|nr:thioredoxin domain-containing protein [Candidatus ainarchaeum sp.]
MKKILSKISKSKKEKPVKEKSIKEVSKKSKKKINKDILIIVLLSIIVIGIIVTAVLLIPKTYDQNDLSIPDTNINVPEDIDQNISIDINKDQRMAEIEAEAEELSRKMLVEIQADQLNIFETWYAELSLNKDQINACLIQNDYLNENLDFENAKIIEKLSLDYYLAQSAGITGTPGIFVNSHFIPGYINYADISKIIDNALMEKKLVDINFESESTYVIDSKKAPILNVIYNKDSDQISNTITTLENNPDSNFFKDLFTELSANKIDYQNKDAQEILKLIGAPFLPLFYIEGDINQTNIHNTEEFDYVFIEVQEGLYVLNPQATGISQQLLYEDFKTEDDYVIGDKNSKVTIIIFTDYSCGYCKLFDTEVLPEIMTNYVDTNKVNVIIKDLALNQEVSLFPAIFSRCAQEQGKYVETHKKLFENNELFTSNLVQNVQNKYMEDMNKLQEEYYSLLVQ